VIAAGVNQSAMVTTCEQHSADSNKTLRLYSDWQTCNRSYEIEIAAKLSLFCGQQLKFQIRYDTIRYDRRD